jgi:fimbrial isopeptide formation D2 family protein
MLHTGRASAWTGRLRWRRRWTAFVAAVAATVLVAPLAAGTAVAAEGDPEYLEVTKRVDHPELVAGSVFTYTIGVTCSEQACVDAELTDALPAELEGFTVNSVNATTAVAREVTWTEAGTPTAQPTVVGPATAVRVAFTEAMPAGATFTLTLTLQVPDDVTPRDQTIVNTARTTATNSAPDAAEATVHLDVPVDLAVDLAKTWEPAQRSFETGAPSTVSLTARNTSNAALDTLVVTEPQGAEDGATALDADNPFGIADLTALDADLPQGATSVQVDAYVFDGSTWSWRAGTPGATAALPEGVDAAAVGGLRLTYAGAIAPGATATAALALAQRATDRSPEPQDLSTERHEVDNVAAATGTLAGQDPVTDTAAATHVVVPASVAVDVTKDLAPARISAGEAATATISATSRADVPVRTLTVTDRGYFTDGVGLGGFRSLTWPAGAAGADVVYDLPDGGTTTETLTPGQTPAQVPDGATGFVLTFTGAIEPGAGTTLVLDVVTTEDAGGEAAQRTTTNTAAGEVVAPNGQRGTDEASDTLQLVTPALTTTLDKTVRPASAVEPGARVVSELRSRVVGTSEYTVPTQIVVEDRWDGAAGTYWDAFDLAGVASTQVPSGAGLRIEAFGPDGAVLRLADLPAQEGPFLAALTAAQIDAALAELPDAPARTDLTGIRFVLTDADGFAVDQTFTPYVAGQARSTLRSGGPVTAQPETPVGFRNTATVTATGETRGGTPLEDDATDTATATVVRYDTEGDGVGISKRWSAADVPAQSGLMRSTDLGWRVRDGFATVAIADPAQDPAATPVSETVFDAFDLVRIEPVAASSTPYSNGWFLRYDSVTAVELFVGGEWQAVPAPNGGWVQGGRFVGYVLTDQQRAQATGARLVLAENTAAREAAQRQGAALDPYAPLPGTGVAASSTDRTFTLTWQVRNTTRSSGAFVTQETALNGGEGTVDNVAGITGTPLGGGDPSTDTDSEAITLTYSEPGVRVTKTATPGQPVHVPREGSGAEQPTISYTATAQSTAVARASYVRITDPAGCGESAGTCQSVGNAAGATGDPFTADVDWLRPGGVQSPFDRLDITAVTVDVSRPAEVDLDQSVAWVLRHDADAPEGERYVSERTTIADLVTWAPERLADVVGVSVTFQAPDPGGQGGTITAANRLTLNVATALRTHVRSTGEPVELRAGQTVDTVNRAFGQSYDPVLAPTTETGDVADADVVLTGGTIDVTPGKQVAPTALTEPGRRTPVTVTLGAASSRDPLATLAPAQVWLRDDATSSPEFWDAFDFTGLGRLTAPAGADQVAVDVYGPFGAGGAMAWTSSAPTPVDAAAVPVPAERYDEVEGVRVTFSRADGAFFSPVVPAPAWSAQAAFTVTLRDTHRASGEPVEMAGSVRNTVTVQSDRLTGEASPERSTSASVALSEGTRQLAVRKVANEGNHTTSVGAAVPWDLTFTNTGTGYLTVTELRDTLPATLLYTGETAPAYATSDGGTLSTDVALAVDGRDLVLTWPEGGRRMQPGETFTVRLYLELQPGLATGQRATNTMTVRTAEQLAQCTGISGAGTTTAWSTDPTTCGTTDYVSPVSGPNLYSVKGVRGAVDGATNPARPDAVCSPTLQAAGGSWYRSPCVANSVVGGTDDWVLHVVNAGTTAVDEMVLFEQLPTGGDQLLLTGASRGSTYRPLLTGMPQVAAPAGTTVKVEVTTDAGVCVGTWRTLTTAAVCEQNGERWTVAGDDTDWSAVTGLRVSLDFRSTASKRLDSGETVDVTYSTVNRMASGAAVGGVDPATPHGADVAWNQFGAKWRYTGDAGFERFAPSQVGVQLPTGAVRVDKQVTGDAAGYAPADFTADVVCTVDGVTLDLGDAATLAVTGAGGLTARVDGLPVGTECTVTESGDLGAFGETTRTGGPATVAVDTATAPGAEVPATQVVTLGNDYAFSGLSVTKQVDTAADAEDLGPFDFTVVCTSATGEPVTFDDAGTTELTFSVAAGETFTAPEGTVPARATCVVTETTADAPHHVVVAGDGVTDRGDASAEVAVGTTPAEVTFVNGYDAGVVRVVKEVDGAGAAAYGAGPFGFRIVCTRDGRSVLDQEFDLDAGGSRTFGTFVAGTACAVTETAAGGATRTALSPEDGTVQVVAPQEGETVSEAVVTATNTFDVADLELVKQVDGPGAELYGTGPFEAQVVCTRQVDGETVPVALPDDGRVALTAEGGLRATVAGLPVGAECAVTETATGGATRTATSADGPVVVGGDEPATVTLTNTFELASLAVTKRLGGDTEVAPDAPYTVQLVCTRPVDGADVDVEIPGGGVREIVAGETLTFTDLPAGADCAVTETGTGGAAAVGTVVTADGEEVASADGAAVDVTLGGTPGGPQRVEVTVTNTFVAPEPEPSPEPSTDPSPEPSTDPSPEPSTDPSPEPSTDPSPEPSTDPSPDPGEQPGGGGQPGGDGGQPGPQPGDGAPTDGGSAAPAGDAADGPTDGELARTGVGAGTAVLALLLVVAGLVTLAVRRRTAR